MIAEAIDTVWTLGWALLVWIILLAIVATVALYAVVVIAWSVTRGAARAVLGAWRMLRARPTAERTPDDPQAPHDAHSAPETPSRPTPTWARAQPPDCEEVA